MQEERPTYAFGPFVLRPDTGDLWNAGRRVKLAPQPFQVLALIVTRAGELVSREEVRNAVWADGTTVEFDQGLNYCLRQIRIALHDDARRPVYIETVPKRGYRLLVPVVRLPTAAAADQPVQPADAMFSPWSNSTVVPSAHTAFRTSSLETSSPARPSARPPWSCWVHGGLRRDVRPRQ
jgi:DNA-binding winged helix-turn-helix (wHTH) protein